MKGTSPGTVIQGAIVTISDNLLLSSDAEVTHTGATSYIKKKEFAMAVSGYFRIKCKVKIVVANGQTGMYTIYRNGAAWGVEHVTAIPKDTYQEFTDNLIFGAGDLLQLYIKTSHAAETVSVKELRIYGDEGVGAGVEAPVP